MGIEFWKGVVLMIMSIGSYVRRGQRFLRRWTADPRLRTAAKGAGYLLLGLLLSAASLGNCPQPLVPALLAAGMSGWPSLLVAAGGAWGYWLFWGNAGAEGLVWTAAALVICLAFGGRRLVPQMALLRSALAALSVAAGGLCFQLLLGRQVGLGMYFLRIGLAFGAAQVFSVALERREPVMDWLAAGLAVLALAQVWGLGYVAAGALAAAAPFPAAALAGLALDLARVAPVPVTAALCLAWLVRFLPGVPKWAAHAAPAAAYLLCAALCGCAEWQPALPLLLGGAAGIFLPPQTAVAHRRGETGVAQVRLEMTAGVLAQAEQLLLEAREYPIDEAAILSKSVDRACDNCPCRKGCRDQEAAARMSPQLLHRPLLTAEELPVDCRKRGRLLLELRRGQDQYRIIRADRDRQREYRAAVIQQYRFLAEYLQDLADSLPRRGEELRPKFEPEVEVCTVGRERANGDKCLWFAGTACRYYVVLCDGMGTGLGAEAEGRDAADILRHLLCAGYPAAYALRSLNSLCVLRGRSGAVTVDLLEIELHTGKATLYKWGAAPSWLLTAAGPEKIGTAGPPPGLSVSDTRETVDRLSLRRGETLILLSDGVDGEEVRRRAWDLTDERPGEMASKVLRCGRGESQDDATAAVIRLLPAAVTA